MEIGELYQIEDKSMNLEQRVLWAAKRYQRQYGQAPTLCLLPPNLLQGGQGRLGNVRLEAKQSLLPDYLWMGEGGDAEDKPLAR